MKKQNKLKMHCEVCSVGGTRLSPETEIAVIEELKFPFKKEFLSPLYSDRGETQVFPGTDFSTFKCPKGGHPIFILTEQDIEIFSELGITRVLTGEGFKRVNPDKLRNALDNVVEPGDIDNLVVKANQMKAVNEEEMEKKKQEGEHKCVLCKKHFSSPQSAMGHISKMHPNIKNKRKYIKRVVKNG